MGKKKDKATKSEKKKERQEPAMAANAESVETVEIGSDQPEETARGSNVYVEYVTTEDVMELVNSLDQNLDQLDKSTQALQQQITQNQRALQRQLMLFKVVALVLVIAVLSIGYSAARSDSRATKNVDAMSAGMSEIRGQIKSMTKSIGTMSRDMDKIEAKLNTLSANVIRIDQSVSKLAKDVNKINANSTPPTYDPWHTGRQWRR